VVKRRPREILQAVEIGGLQLLPVPEDNGLFHVSVPSARMSENLAAELCQRSATEFYRGRKQEAWP
jgi:hypothetical protein